MSSMFALAHSSCLHMSVPTLSSYSSTSSTPQTTLPINKHCEDPQNEECGPVANTTFYGAPRNNSSSTARLARGRSATPNLILWREVTVLAERPLLARITRPPRSSSILSFEEEEDLGWAKELLPTLSLEGQAYSDPVLESPRLPRARTGIGPSLACTAPPSRPQAPLALARNTSRTRSACLGGSTPTSSTRRCLPCSAGSPPAPSPRPPVGSHERGSAGTARRTASTDPSRWASFCGRPVPNGLSSSAPRSCACTSGALACQVLVRASVFGAAPSNPSRPTARSSRSSRPIWTWSTCLATLSGHASARPCARTSRKLQPGLVGNTKPTPSLSSPQVPPSPTSRAPRACMRPPERQQEFQGWDTPYVHDTVDVLAPESRTTALGSAFGSREHINAPAWESVRACDECRSATGSVDRAPTEMVLPRQCADVSKLMYHMRINGDVLDQDLPVAFDGQLRASVTASLSGDSPDHYWWQATAGVTCGGLGLRAALGDCAPRHRRQSHRVSPLGVHHGRPLQSCFCLNQLIMAVNDARTDAALTRLVSTLPPNAAQLPLGQLDEALAERELSWRNVLSGIEDVIAGSAHFLRHAGRHHSR